MVDGVIVLYDQNETSFTTNGLGYLPDATECIVTEELNGEFELQMEYPINGLRYKEIQHRRILLVKTNPYEDPQPFRIYNINKPIDGLVEINARHISYDLSGYALPWIDDGDGEKSDLPFATGPASFMANFPNLVNQLNSGMPQFTYWTNSTEDWPRNPSGGSEAEKENELKEPHWIFVDQPMNARNLIGQFTEKYKGEFKWDKFNVQFYGPVAGQSEDDTRYRGKDSGVVLRYGKNLTDLMQEEDSDKGMYTHIYPYWSGSIEYTKTNGEKGNKETVIELPDKLYPVFNDHTPDYKRIYVYDCTSDYTAELQSKDGQKYPSEETLREMCDKLIKNNKLGTPNITLTASFVQLSKSVEYKDLALLEKILLGDTVTVYFPDLDVDSTLKCTSVEYNVLTDEYRTITLGEANTSVSNTIANTASMSSSNSTAIAGSATKNDVFGKSYDTALSTTSENAVQNKVVTGAINSTNGRVKSLEDCCKSVKQIIQELEESGAKVTYGAANPSGGKDGDIYVQLTQTPGQTSVAVGRDSGTFRVEHFSGSGTYDFDITGSGRNDVDAANLDLTGLAPNSSYRVQFTAVMSYNARYYQDYTFGTIISQFDTLPEVEHQYTTVRGSYDETRKYQSFYEDNASHTYTFDFTTGNNEESVSLSFVFQDIQDSNQCTLTVSDLIIVGGAAPSADTIKDLYFKIDGLWSIYPRDEAPEVFTYGASSPDEDTSGVIYAKIVNGSIDSLSYKVDSNWLPGPSGGGSGGGITRDTIWTGTATSGSFETSKSIEDYDYLVMYSWHPGDSATPKEYQLQLVDPKLISQHYSDVPSHGGNFLLSSWSSYYVRGRFTDATHFNIVSAQSQGLCRIDGIKFGSDG